VGVGVCAVPLHMLSSVTLGDSTASTSSAYRSGQLYVLSVSEKHCWLLTAGGGMSRAQARMFNKLNMLPQDNSELHSKPLLVNAANLCSGGSAD
jgi:hypothetical protein